MIVPALEQVAGLPQLQALGDAWCEYLLAGPLPGRTFEGGCFFTNALFEFDDLESNAVREAVRQQYNRFIDLVERCTRDAVAQGHFRSDLEIPQFAFEFFGIQFSTLAWRGLGRETLMIAMAKRAMADLFQRSAS